MRCPATPRSKAPAALSFLLGANPGLHRGLLVGPATGLLVVARSIAGNYAFGGKTFKQWLHDAGYHVVQFTGFGLVLWLWP